MTDKLKCPFCGLKLEQYWYEDFECWYCPDVACKGYVMTATKDMWQELIRTRKALKIAVDALKSIDWCAQDYAKAQEALEQIKHKE